MQDRPMSPRLSRRQFVLATSATALAAWAGPAAAAPASGWKLRLAGSTSMFGTLSLDEVCRRFAELGFEAVDIWHARFHAPHLEEIETRLKAEGLRKILDRHQLKLSAISTYGTTIDRAAPLLEALGGELAVRGSAAALKPDEPLAPRMKLFFEQLKPDLELAERHGFRLAIENHSNSLLNSLDSFKAFADANPAPDRVGVAMAPFHLQRERVPMGAVFAAIGPMISFFYAWQLGKTLDQLPGIGPLDFTPWLAELAKAGYRGHLNPFTHFQAPPDEMQAALLQSRDNLIRCAARLT